MSEIINPNDETRIEDGSKVQLHFSVAIENGVEIDNTRSRDEPVSLVIGDGNLLPGFEKALFGLRAGDRRTVSLPPGDAFGEWNPENVQRFDTVKFEQRPEVGHMIEFEDKAKASLFGVVIDFLHVHYQTWNFPVFNLADCAITLGTILLLIDTFFLEKKRHQTPSA